MSWRSILVLAVLFPVGAMVGCSDPPSRPAATQGGVGPIGGGGGGGGGGEGGVDSGFDAGDGGVCSDLVNIGQTFDRVGIVGDPPVAKGGVIADGTYVLSDYSVYVGAGGIGGPTGITAKGTIRIGGGQLDEILELGGSGNPSVRNTSSAYSASGATFAVTQLCPASVGRQYQFTSNDPILLLTDLTTKEAFTFTKR